MTQELFREDSYVRECDATVVAIDDGAVILDRTIFYPLGGGQPGDTGALKTPGGATIRIADTRKDRESGTHLHIPEDNAHGLKPGDSVTAEIDWDRRHRLMRMHTCLHLLCAVVHGPVTGGSVGEAKGRLDFDLPEMTLDKDHITAELNRLIEENHPVGATWITDDEMAAKPDLVRTMSVKPPMGAGRVRLMEIEGVDLQPCGGTHVRRTGEIGPVRVAKIENKGRQNRRINIVFAD